MADTQHERIAYGNIILIFSWMYDMLNKSGKRSLLMQDIYEIPASDSSHVLSNRLRLLVAQFT